MYKIQYQYPLSDFLSDCETLPIVRNILTTQTNHAPCVASNVHPTMVFCMLLQMFILPWFSCYFKCSSFHGSHATSNVHPSMVLMLLQMFILPWFSCYFKCSSFHGSHATSNVHPSMVLMLLQMFILPRSSAGCIQGRIYGK